MRNRSDEEIVRLVQSGHVEAYEDIVHRYGKRIAGWALKSGFDRFEAEDILQEVLVSVYSQIDRIDPTRKLSAYILAATKNEMISLWRKKKRMVSLDQAMYLPVSEPDDWPEHEELTTRMEKLVRKLEKKQQQVLRLYYWQEMSYQEISHLTKIPLNTVRTLLRRAKARLKKIVQVYG